MTSILEISRDEKLVEKQSATQWWWIFVVLILALITGTIVIVIFATHEKHESLPDKIDVVLYDRGRGRSDQQVIACRQNITFVNNIYILSSTITEKSTVQNVTYLPFSGSISSCLEFIPKIPGIAEHAMFLSDQTFPFRKITKKYMFYGQRPRLFNIFRDQSEVNFFTAWLEETMPTFVMSVSLLRDSTDWKTFIFKEVTSERTALRHDMNRDIFITSALSANSAKQLSILDSVSPIFATFHISETDPNQTEANAQLTKYLREKFVDE